MTSVRSAGLLDEEVLWTVGVAMPAETKAAAAAALRAMPASMAATGGYLHLAARVSGAYAGRALLLADRADEALPFLRVATASCLALDDPFLHTRARLWLGQALERTADTKGACASYQGVLRRWGSATTRVVTVEAAQKRLSALRCPR
jgi:hypothetical protein